MSSRVAASESARLLASAVEAATAGGRVLLAHFGRASLRVSRKPGAGLVTNADLGSERAIVRILSRARPDFGFLTEEAPERAGPKGRWIVDPLDGTTNYVHGFPMFCVSIAAELEGKVVAGVVFNPVLGDLYVARVGHGAFVGKRRLRVSRSTRIEDSLLTTGFTYQKEKHLKAELAAFGALSKLARAVRRPGSAAMDLAYVARGVFDGFWERRLSPWDIAAGALLVSEAGGIVTDFHGGPFLVDAPAIVAAGPRLHGRLVNAITACEKRFRVR